MQLYIGNLKSSEDRPAKELKNFKKISLEPGETKTVEFEINGEELLCFSTKHKRWMTEKGKYRAYVCASETDVRGSVDFDVEYTDVYP